MTAFAVRSAAPFIASLEAPAAPEAAPEAAPAIPEAALEAAPASPEAALRAAPALVAAALLKVDVAAPITSLPVVRVSNMVRPAPISNVPPEVKAAGDKIISGWMDGSYNVYAGPIKDQTGAIKVAAGSTLSNNDILGLNWLVDGVEGKMS